MRFCWELICNVEFLLRGSIVGEKFIFLFNFMCENYYVVKKSVFWENNKNKRV